MRIAEYLLQGATKNGHSFSYECQHRNTLEKPQFLILSGVLVIKVEVGMAMTEIIETLSNVWLRSTSEGYDGLFVVRRPNGWLEVYTVDVAQTFNDVQCCFEVRSVVRSRVYKALGISRPLKYYNIESKQILDWEE